MADLILDTVREIIRSTLPYAWRHRLRLGKLNRFFDVSKWVP